MKPLTHTEIGKLLGMSREKVRRIEKEAMRKLREACGSGHDGPMFIQESCGVVERVERKGSR